MNNEFLSKRHYQIWEEQNKHIRRTVTASLIFAVVAFFNVILPFKEIYLQKAAIKAEIDSSKALIAGSELALARLGELENKLLAVNLTLERRPWETKRDELIHSYRQLNETGGGSRAQYQAMADSTVAGIARTVQDSVYKPLADYLVADSLAARQMPLTNQLLRSLPQTLDNWVRENLGKVWYSTLNAKEATVNELSQNLDRHLRRLTRAIREERDGLQHYRITLEQRIEELQRQSNMAQQEERLHELEARLAEILPSWVKGLISLKQMVQIFPVVMSFVFFYILGLAFTMMGHYDMLARQDSATYKGNAVVSSIWTLTDRGRTGTVFTTFAYTAVAAILWYFFEKGMAVLNYSLVVDKNFNKGLENYMFLAWLLRAAMLAAVVFVFVKYRQKLKREA